MASKVVFGDKVIIDLTGDTVTKDVLLSGVTAHDKTGAQITGECTFDSDTQDATVSEDEVLSGRTFYARGVKGTGKMENNEGVQGYIKVATEQYSIPQGFHDGSGKVGIDPDELAKIIPANIKKDVTILGQKGTHEGGANVTAQSKEVTPGVEAQTVLPDAGYDYLAQVRVAGIPYEESENSAGGITVRIG